MASVVLVYASVKSISLANLVTMTLDASMIVMAVEFAKMGFVFAQRDGWVWSVMKTLALAIALAMVFVLRASVDASQDGLPWIALLTLVPIIALKMESVFLESAAATSAGRGPRARLTLVLSIATSMVLARAAFANVIEDILGMIVLKTRARNTALGTGSALRESAIVKQIGSATTVLLILVMGRAFMVCALTTSVDVKMNGLEPHAT